MTECETASRLNWDPSMLAAYQRLRVNGDIFECWVTYEAVCAHCGRLGEEQVLEAVAAYYDIIAEEWRRRIRAGRFDGEKTVWLRAIPQRETPVCREPARQEPSVP